MLSLMTRLSQSMVSWDFLNIARTLSMVTWKMMKMNGTMPSMASASRQLMRMRRMLAPIMTNIEEMIVAMACDTYSFTASTSEVRLVRSLAGVIRSRNEQDCTAILAARRVRKSLATRSEA